jgi:hypothetical protein
MADDDKKSFFATLPGLITAIAALIGALTTLYIALHHHDGQHTGGQVDSTKISSSTKAIDSQIHSGTTTPQTPPQAQPTGDQFKVTSILPAIGSPLSGQQDFDVFLKLHYKLVSADSLILVPYILQFANGDECATGTSRIISDSKDGSVKIKQGEGDVDVKIHYMTGKYVTTGQFANGNHVSINAALLPVVNDSQNSKTLVQKQLWNNKDFCYPFQP